MTHTQVLCMAMTIEKSWENENAVLNNKGTCATS
jgi:hypothetical protein